MRHVEELTGGTTSDMLCSRRPGLMGPGRLVMATVRSSVRDLCVAWNSIFCTKFTVADLISLVEPLSMSTLNSIDSPDTKPASS